MKKALPFIALGLCALLLVAVVVGIVWFAKSVKEKTDMPTNEDRTVKAYFEETWPDFCPVVYNEEAQTVTLQKQIECTYDQACSFGKAVYEDVALGHIDTMEVMMTACSSLCHVTLTDITVYGISLDGEMIYTVHADGRLTGCWED